MTGSIIPFVALDRQYRNIRDEIRDQTDRVLSTGHVLDGAYTREFETAIAARTTRKYAVAVNSCSTALLIACSFYAKYEDINRISLPAVSFVASANAPKLANYNIDFVDVDRNGMMNIDELRLCDTNCDLISYVNLFGNVLDYDKLKLVAGFFGKDAPIVEDAAQSFGASYYGIPSGKLGDVSCLSFDPTKNLPNYGSGGMLLTDDIAITEFAMNHRDNGKRSQTVGTNVKMSEVDCAQMLVKLKHFDEWQERRNTIADYYTEQLAHEVICPSHDANVVHAWHKYVVQTPHRDSMKNFLNIKCNIETKVHYEQTLPSYFGLDDRYPLAQELARTSLSLPIYPEMTDAEVEYVVKSVKQFRT